MPTLPSSTTPELKKCDNNSDELWSFSRAESQLLIAFSSPQNHQQFIFQIELQNPLMSPIYEFCLFFIPRFSHMTVLWLTCISFVTLVA